MGKARVRLAAGVLIEEVGGQLLVMVGEPPHVVRLSDEAKSVVSLLEPGKNDIVELDATIQQLAELGILDIETGSAISRRRVLKLTALSAGTGAAVLAFPAAAAASSEVFLSGTYLPNPPGGNPSLTFFLDTSAVTEPPTFFGTPAADLTVQGQTVTFPFDAIFEEQLLWNKQDADIVDPGGAVLFGSFSGSGTTTYNVRFTEAP